MPNEKISLSLSNPVFAARSKSEGGSHYAGTKIGSVRPSRDVQRLMMTICFRKSLLLIRNQTMTQMPMRIRLQSSHARCIIGSRFCTI